MPSEIRVGAPEDAGLEWRGCGPPDTEGNLEFLREEWIDSGKKKPIDILLDGFS